jgi:hypothetical protein
LEYRRRRSSLAPRLSFADEWAWHRGFDDDAAPLLTSHPRLAFETRW